MPSFTKSRVEVGGAFRRPTWMTSTRKSRSGTTLPTPKVAPYLLRKGTRVPLRYDIVSSKNCGFITSWGTYLDKVLILELGKGKIYGLISHCKQQMI